MARRHASDFEMSRFRPGVSPLFFCLSTMTPLLTILPRRTTSMEIKWGVKRVAKARRGNIIPVSCSLYYGGGVILSCVSSSPHFSNSHDRRCHPRPYESASGLVIPPAFCLCSLSSRALHLEENNHGGHRACESSPSDSCAALMAQLDLCLSLV